MTSARRKVLIVLYQTFDLVIMLISFMFASIFIFKNFYTLSLVDLLSMRVKVVNFLLFAGFLFIWHHIFRVFHLYESKRLSKTKKEIQDILKASVIATLVLYALSIIFRIDIINHQFVLVFFISATILTITSRMGLRFLLKQVRIHGRNLRYLLIIGTNRRAVSFANKIINSPQYGYRLSGFVDEEWPGIQEFQETGYPLIANFNNFSEYLREHVVDEVAIGLPMKSYYPQASRIVTLCEEQGITVRFPNSLFNVKNGHQVSEEFEEFPLLTISSQAIGTRDRIIKRSIDFFISILLLIVLSPVFGMVALLIKFTSPGPVFFVQERVGLYKRKFKLYKFRTMTPDAEKKQIELENLNEAEGPVFKIENDPRITPVGKFLRKTSIDELPQLFNVIMGEMSLVGPRPLPLRDYQGFSEDWHRRRFSVKPGITCTWQVNGRSKLPFARWMELDMKYIDNWSIWLDLKILLKTIPVVLRGIGAS